MLNDVFFLKQTATLSEKQFTTIDIYISSCEQDVRRLKLVPSSKDKKSFLSPMNCILREEQ